MAGDMMNRETILVVNMPNLPSNWDPKHKFEYADLQGDLPGLIKRLRATGMIIKSDDVDTLSDIVSKVFVPTVFVTESMDVRCDLAIEETKICVSPGVCERELVDAISVVTRA